MYYPADYPALYPREKDITEYSNQMQALEANLKECQDRHRDLLEQLKKSDMMKNQAKVAYEDTRGDKAYLSEQLQELQQNIVRVSREIENLDKVKVDLSQKSERHIRDKQEAANQLKACLEEAESVGERVDTDRTAEVIETELSRVQRQLKAGEEEIGDIEILKEQYDEKHNLLQSMKKELKSAQSSLDKMKASYRLRNQMVVAMKARLTVSLKYNFICNLQIQKFGGKLIIDHEDKSIQIKVSKDFVSNCVNSNNNVDRKTALNTTFRDLRGLSGGERSFTTVSFILAMWRLMEVPFRFLDEFDVFMDAENRRMATHMFMDFKSGNAIRSQLTLLTPTDLELLRKNPENVRIFELQAPRDNAGQGKNGKKRRLDEDNGE
uniref:Structural maintenance of chromosomes protein 6 n=1 Tax=Romanomermis culicivorax TaxID=13658 RepID=A0A915K6Y9_ROMCU